MSEQRSLRGFEDRWRPEPRKGFAPEDVLKPGWRGVQARAHLTRLVSRAPEVVVKYPTTLETAGKLRRHLDYVSRNGELKVEDERGNWLDREDLHDLACEWGQAARQDSERTAISPLAKGFVLAMPPQTDVVRLEAATRAFASEAFGRFERLMALHTDTPHPHVHLTVRALALSGERLSNELRRFPPQARRELFAEKLRERGVPAGATWRRDRGITRKSERTPIRKIQERFVSGKGQPARTVMSAYEEAAGAAFGSDAEVRPWEMKLLERQADIREAYAAQAELLMASGIEAHRELGRAVKDWIQRMPAPDSRRLALARELREAQALREAKREQMRPRERVR